MTFPVRPFAARGFRLGLLGLAAILVWTATAPAAFSQYFGRNKVQYETFDFRVLSTEHFDIHYYPEAEEGVRDAARMAERWYTRLSNVLGHEFQQRRAIILYADDGDFRQTNVIGGQIGEGVQGLTEGFRLRVVMPLTGSYADTDHVLGHELIHQFQYDISQRTNQFGTFIRLPLWLVEGMAEYFSVGRHDTHTAMWIRDAVIRDAFPTLEQLTRDQRYFPYRYGQAFWAWVGGTYGDEAATQLFRASLAMPLDSAIVSITGLNADQLSERWQEEVEQVYLPRIEGMQTPPYEGRDIEGTSPERLDSLGLVEMPGRRVLARDIDGGNLNVAPQVSPDGRYVAFLSERDLFSIDLFLADAQTGQVLQRLQSVDLDPHLDAIRFIDSAGTWSPDGQRFAFVTFARGQNEIAILDVASRQIEQRIQVTGVTAIKDPDWSPDGQSLVFTGMRGGIADLFVVDINGGQARQLTSDRHADLQPIWSPDGRQIAFATDRGPETDFDDLTYSPLLLAILDRTTNEIELLDVFPGAKHINPQFTPDGESIVFVSDPNGIPNVFRLHLPTNDVFQITNVATGISGITGSSPTHSVARQSGLLMYSVFEAQNHNVYALEPEDAQGMLIRAGEGEDEVATATAAEPAEEAAPEPVDEIDPPEVIDSPPDEIADASDIAPEAQEAPTAAPTDRISNDSLLVMLSDTIALAPVTEMPVLDERLDGDETTADDEPLALLGTLPPAVPDQLSRVQRYLASAHVGLPSPEIEYPDQPYRPRLALDYISQPTAGVGYDPYLGVGVGGGIAARFSDMLGDNVLGVVLQANGTLRDIGGQAVFLNQRRRLNYGASAAHIPFLQVYFTNPLSGIYRVLQRTYITQAAGIGLYPLSQTRRFEAQVGVQRIAYGFEVDMLVGNTIRRQSLSTEEAAGLFGFADSDALAPLYLTQAGAAYVGDYSFFGFTSPIRGGRYRFGLDGTFGSMNYASATADYRRYLFFRPFFTLAMRGTHYGRYGPDADSNRLFPLFLGNSTIVRGYQLGSYERLSVDQAETTLNQLYGTSLGFANIELRMPLFGTTDFGLFDFPYLPTELSLFADAGMAWGELSGSLVGGESIGRSLTDARPVFSTGVSARVNLLGALVLEFYYALAFNRADDRLGVGGLTFYPGW